MQMMLSRLLSRVSAHRTKLRPTENPPWLELCGLDDKDILNYITRPSDRIPMRPKPLIATLIFFWEVVTFLAPTVPCSATRGLLKQTGPNIILKLLR